MDFQSDALGEDMPVSKCFDFNVICINEICALDEIFDVNWSSWNGK